MLSFKWISWSDSSRVNKMLSQCMLEALMKGFIVPFLGMWMRHPDNLVILIRSLLLLKATWELFLEVPSNNFPFCCNYTQPNPTLPCCLHRLLWISPSISITCCSLQTLLSTCEMCQGELILQCQSWQLLVSPSLYVNLPLPSLIGRQCMCSLKLRLKLHGKKMTGAAVIFLTKFGHCGYETWELA